MHSTPRCSYRCFEVLLVAQAYENHLLVVVAAVANCLACSSPKTALGSWTVHGKPEASVGRSHPIHSWDDVAEAATRRHPLGTMDGTGGESKVEQIVFEEQSEAGGLGEERWTETEKNHSKRNGKTPFAPW